MKGKEKNKMTNLIKNEWRKVCFPVLSTILLLSIVMCVLSCSLYQDYQIYYKIEAWEIGTQLVNVFFPLLVVLPLCWNLYYERKNNFLLSVYPRVRIEKYLIVKWFVQAVAAFIILFIPYILSAIVVLYVKTPIDLYVPPAWTTPFDHAFLKTFTETPMMYAILFSVWKGILGVLVMTLGYVLSMYVKNIFVILTGPFIYVILENFILSILRLEIYRLVVSFEPSTIASNAYTLGSFMFGPILLIAIIGIIWFYLAKIQRYLVVEV